MIEELTIFFFLSLLLTVIVFAPCKLAGSYILFWLVNFITTATGIGKNESSHLSSVRLGFIYIRQDWLHLQGSLAACYFRCTAVKDCLKGARHVQVSSHLGKWASPLRGM
jgi:hypothetical protein